MRKLKPRGRARGNRCARWRGAEKLMSHNGYVKVRVGKNHPLADPHGYAYEHLVVWVSAGRERPARGFVLHHKSEDKTDNRLDNLVVITRAEHNRIHNAGRARDSRGRLLPKEATR